ncbi:YHS domain-containing (seleno)protein [uncultured Nitrospira sp.]|uniref:YHS domain-containing (seleno)protein n=1 Tax=uncultured Nitrospira sp. TaxID=157176 RepID=UPI0031404097
MKMMRTILGPLFAMILAIMATPAFAGDVTNSTPGISGYDPVAYFMDGKPMRGSGYHVAEHEGVTYAFGTKEHKEMFEANPGKYVPAYGGYCAYGVAVGKKFVSDPEAWEIVQGKLYLNLDRDIQGKWAKDIPGYLKKFEANWKETKDKAPSDL